MGITKTPLNVITSPHLNVSLVKCYALLHHGDRGTIAIGSSGQAHQRDRWQHACFLSLQME